jgi:hypothetical protein
MKGQFYPMTDIFTFVLEADCSNHKPQNYQIIWDAAEDFDAIQQQAVLALQSTNSVLNSRQKSVEQRLAA